MQHELKTWPDDFTAVTNGTKTHEARKNDRNYQVGDTLLLREWIPDNPEACSWERSGEELRGAYTGWTAQVAVTHVTKNGAYGLPPDLAIMSIRLRSKRAPAPSPTAQWDDFANRWFEPNAKGPAISRYR